MTRRAGTRGPRSRPISDENKLCEPKLMREKLAALPRLQSLAGGWGGAYLFASFHSVMFPGVCYCHFPSPHGSPSALPGPPQQADPSPSLRRICLPVAQPSARCRPGFSV